MPATIKTRRFEKAVDQLATVAEMSTFPNGRSSPAACALIPIRPLPSAGRSPSRPASGAGLPPDERSHQP